MTSEQSLQTVDIYTDGSCLGNPGPGGWAAIILVGGHEHKISGNDHDTTNNRMEMTAIIQALTWLREKIPGDALHDLNVNIHSDSSLIINTINQGWKRKANTDLWAEMDKARAWLNLSWLWVKGHSTNKYNNLADELATKMSAKIK